MDNSTAKYIFDYFSRFMTETEQLALKHYNTSVNFKGKLEEIKKNLLEKGWLSDNNEVLAFLANGFEDFQLNTAARILRENPTGIYFNNCPQCGKLARTPQAKQCRFCGHNWHDQVAGVFQIESAFPIIGRDFYITGYVLSGTINIGNKADLTTIGLARKPVIRSIEFALHRIEGISWEIPGLGFSDLSDEEKEFLRSNSPFSAPILIEL
jgi:hypothetical protein